ncbi:hypothetical protein [Dyadobacter tibetensis]|uniref:hypothetical protein n=1 Tax=Dyadobacter tibetensis TaxID=1211851 RepID=UPI000470B788|nr:hypothetical protein [Dyadobacter tibetensis]
MLPIVNAYGGWGGERNSCLKKFANTYFKVFAYFNLKLRFNGLDFVILNSVQSGQIDIQMIGHCFGIDSPIFPYKAYFIPKTHPVL